MKQRNYIKYFRVLKNDTVVTEISTNDFKPPTLRPFKKDWLIGNTTDILCAINDIQYTLPVDGAVFYGYATKAKAMEMAKAGALKYIDQLIKQGKGGIKTLLQYRMDHYEDLHFNLLEANIQIVEDAADAAQQKNDELTETNRRSISNNQ